MVRRAEGLWDKQAFFLKKQAFSAKDNSVARAMQEGDVDSDAWWASAWATSCATAA